MAKRMQHCEYCGEDLGVFDNWMNEPLACGKRECAIWISNTIDQEKEEARYQAEQDNYSRYNRRLKGGDI